MPFLFLWAVLDTLRSGRHASAITAENTQLLEQGGAENGTVGDGKEGLRMRYCNQTLLWRDTLELSMSKSFIQSVLRRVMNLYPYRL